MFLDETMQASTAEVYEVMTERVFLTVNSSNIKCDNYGVQPSVTKFQKIVDASQFLPCFLSQNF